MLETRYSVRGSHLYLNIIGKTSSLIHQNRTRKKLLRGKGGIRDTGRFPIWKKNTNNNSVSYLKGLQRDV